MMTPTDGLAPAAQSAALDAPLQPAPQPSADGTVLAALEATLAKVDKAAGLPDPVEMVHDARKAMKEYRSLLRLVPGARAKAARQATAAAARSLSAARDRAAAREALQHLAEEGLLAEDDLAAALAAIGDDPAPGTEAEEHRAELADFLLAARTQLADGLAEEAAGADVVAGLARAYRQAQDVRFDSPHHMHEARKRVVAHRYQMSFFASVAAGHGEKRAARAQELRDVLGAYQDIETLRPMLEAAAEPLGEARLARLGEAMGSLQKRLKRGAERLHRKLFRRRARAFAGKFRRAL